MKSSLSIYLICFLILVITQRTTTKVTNEKENLRKKLFKSVNQQSFRGMAELSNKRFVYRELIAIPNSIEVSTGQGWTEINHYTRTIYIPKNVFSLYAELSIPFAGKTMGDRWRLKLMLDNVEVGQYTNFDSAWVLHQIFLEGKIFNVKKGNHTLKLFVMSQADGKTQLPHMNTGLLEHNNPVITSELYLSGTILRDNFN